MPVLEKITLRGYLFLVNSDQNLRVDTYIDVARGNKTVAKNKVPKETYEDGQARYEHRKSIVRRILQDYQIQHDMKKMEIEFLEGIELGDKEIEAGLGIDEIEVRNRKAAPEPVTIKRRRR